MAEHDPMLQQMLGELAQPQLSPYFEAQLRQRLAEQRRQRLMRRCSHVMGAYWLLVALASSAILIFLPWSEMTGSPVLQAALVIALVTAVVPFWMLLRVFRTGLVDTIVGTFETGEPVTQK